VPFFVRGRFVQLLYNFFQARSYFGVVEREVNVEAERAQRVAMSYGNQKAMALIGATLTEIGEGTATIELSVRSDLTQQHGFVHAGIVTMIVDTACRYAACSTMPPDAAVLTVEFKVNFISPAKGERLIARGRVLKPGRTLPVCQGDVFAVNYGREKLVATMLATMIAKEGTGLVG
jgi:uncharacterized protein (TIGR00369 family)